METPGYVHSFQSLGAVDGPGLRFVVFLQGCPLRCCYCHNPDTWQAGQGQRLLPSQVAARALRYRSYLRHGGVTLTGGEPLWQPRFAAELFALLQAQGLHTALDTSGVGDLEAAAAVLRHTDLALVDVKFLTEEDYLRHTGGRLCHLGAARGGSGPDRRPGPSPPAARLSRALFQPAKDRAAALSQALFGKVRRPGHPLPPAGGAGDGPGRRRRPPPAVAPFPALRPENKRAKARRAKKARRAF